MDPWPKRIVGVENVQYRVVRGADRVSERNWVAGTTRWCVVALAGLERSQGWVADEMGACVNEVGADPEALEQVAGDFVHGASVLKAVAERITARIDVVWWRGAGATGFRAQWGAHRFALSDASRCLTRCADLLTTNALEQRSASGGPAGATATRGPKSIANKDVGGRVSTTNILVHAQNWARGDRHDGPAGATARIQPDDERGVSDRARHEGENDGQARRWSAGGLAGLYAMNRRAMAKALAERQDNPSDARKIEHELGSRQFRFVNGEGHELGSRQFRFVNGEGDELGSRQFLFVDGAGDGHVAEVFGDLATAKRVGVWVPGVSTDLTDFADPGRLGARRIWDRDPDLVMIEWLGYDPPDTIGHAALELGHGAAGAGTDLNRFIRMLKANGADYVVLGGHSYGSVVAAHAAVQGTTADRLVLAGSPGVPASTAEDFILNGRPGGQDNIFVATNRLDAVSFGHLGDELLTGLASGSVSTVAGLMAPAIGSLVVPGYGLVAPGIGGNVPGSGRSGLRWWSGMPYAANSKSFGAQRLPTDGGLLNHSYTSADSISLRSLRRAFSADQLGMPTARNDRATG